MQIIEYKAKNSLSELAARLPFQSSGCVAALGFFDGVHIAHRALLQKARSEAAKLSLPLTVFTFSGKDESFKASSGRIYTDEERAELLSECGAEYILLCDFSAICELSYREFAKEFLIDTLNTKVAVCGFNFKFGKGALGNAELLSSVMKDEERSCIIMGEFLHTGSTVSSTRIRKLIGEGSMTDAAALLGKPYFISGTVTHGRGFGKTMGLPTVNTELSHGRFIPPSGVYASVIYIDGVRYGALTNIGTCPTFDRLGKRSIHAETYILNFSSDIYGEKIKVYLISYLREEKAFSGEKELLMQINIDKKQTIKILGDTEWQEIGLS